MVTKARTEVKNEATIQIHIHKTKLEPQNLPGWGVAKNTGPGEAVGSAVAGCSGSIHRDRGVGEGLERPLCSLADSMQGCLLILVVKYSFFTQHVCFYSKYQCSAKFSQIWKLNVTTAAKLLFKKKQACFQFFSAFVYCLLYIKCPQWRLSQKPNPVHSTLSGLHPTTTGLQDLSCDSNET